MVDVLLNDDLSQQARRSQAAIDDRRRDRLGHDNLAGTAGVLRINIATHEEHQRLDVELLAGVLADLHQRRAANGTVAAIGLVNGGQPFQLRRQGASLRLGARCLGCRRDALGLCRLQRGLHGGDVLGYRLIKQSALHRVHALRLGGKLHPAQTLQLIGKLANQRITLAQRALVRGNRRIALGDTGTLLAHHLVQRVDVNNRLKCASIHARILAV